MSKSSNFIYFIISNIALSNFINTYTIILYSFIPYYFLYYLKIKIKNYLLNNNVLIILYILKNILFLYLIILLFCSIHISSLTL